MHICMRGSAHQHCLPLQRVGGIFEVFFQAHHGLRRGAANDAGQRLDGCYSHGQVGALGQRVQVLGHHAVVDGSCRNKERAE